MSTLKRNHSAINSEHNDKTHNKKVKQTIIQNDQSNNNEIIVIEDDTYPIIKEEQTKIEENEVVCITDNNTCNNHQKDKLETQSKSKSPDKAILKINVRKPSEINQLVEPNSLQLNNNTTELTEHINIPRKPENLIYIATISVHPVNKSDQILIKEQFKTYGAINACKIKNHTCTLRFKDRLDALNAMVAKNNTTFESNSIQIKPVSVIYDFTKDNTVLVRNVTQPKLQNAMEQFGTITYKMILPSSNVSLYMYDSIYSVRAALSTKIVKIFHKEFEIEEFNKYVFVHLNTCILLYGVKTKTKAKFIIEELSKYCTVTCVIFDYDEMNKSIMYALVGILNEKDVARLVAMKTITVKEIVLNIKVPSENNYFNHPNMKRIHTQIHQRQPVCLFVENLHPSTKNEELWNIFSSFGLVYNVNRINNNYAAIITFIKAASVLKALESDLNEIDNSPITLHEVDGVDGVYQPIANKTIDDNASLYISGISSLKLILNLIQEIRKLGVAHKHIIPVKDLTTKAFKNACCVQFANETTAEVVLNSKIVIDNNEMKIEKYNSVKPEYESKDNTVLVENLDRDVDENDLKMAFQIFGEINNTIIIRNWNQTVDCGYVQFRKVSDASKALIAGCIDVKETKALIAKRYLIISE